MAPSTHGPHQERSLSKHRLCGLCSRGGHSERAWTGILDYSVRINDGGLLLAAATTGDWDPSKPMDNEKAVIYYPIHKTVHPFLSYACTKALLDVGVDVNAVHILKGLNATDPASRRDTEETALHMAIRNDKEDRLKVILLLLEAGANPNAQRRELVNVYSKEQGWRNIPTKDTPILLAIRLNLPNIVRVLVSHGADTSATYHYGTEQPPVTAAERAAKAGPEMVEALRCRWEPQYHRYYPALVRQRIFTILCVAKKQKWGFDPELVLLICQWAAFPTCYKEAPKKV